MQNKKYKEIIKKSKTVYDNLNEKLKILDLLENTNIGSNLMIINFADFNSDFVSPNGIELIIGTLLKLI